ncbi:MAG: aminotransferase [Spirochaetes bacterium]|nr:MAG: aminotransferase [Spirochaetota bacterium]RKX98884.1 MAG: aminotransferase [Spirochaetota bacterium]
MRRDIVHIGAGQLRYEIREIVQTAHELNKLGRVIIWENIGDPVQKGEPMAGWIKDIISSLVSKDFSYAYTASAGDPETRAFLAKGVNARGGAQIGPDDILFFNGLGDAVSTLFTHLRREARILGPSPAYSTLSSAEASHSGYEHLTYRLDPEKQWQPDIDDIRMKVKYNDSVAGILLINPDNPTGAVYPRSTLEEIVKIAREHDLFVLCDETYSNIVYPGIKTASLSEVIGDTPGIALRSISKEFPWPGARCGWMEVFNQDKDDVFRRYITSLLDAKRLEVCSTTLPQMAIPLVFSDSRYPGHIKRRAKMFSDRADEAVSILSDIPGITVIKPSGAFYLTVVFNTELPSSGPIPAIDNPAIAGRVSEIVADVAPDKRFVYWLLGATGICTVPLSGFCTKLPGFRATLLENNNKKRRQTYNTLAVAIRTYLN